MNYKYIVIEGNIGVGKTTLTKLIAPKIKANILLEKFKNNHFLPLFYNDMQKYGLHVELSFLIDRLEDIESLKESGIVIADYYFTKTLLFAKANLDIHAYKIFERVFSKFAEKSKKPDLVIYLKRSVDELMKNIEKRGRKIENSISKEYLSSIQKSYDTHFSESKDLKILSLNISGVDFVKNEDIVDEIILLTKKGYKNGVTSVNLK